MWKQDQQWEGRWWNTCQNTFYEEQKQFVYAEKMGLKRVPNEKTPYRFDLRGKKVLDIGCGPISLLLKCDNVEGTAIDPLKFPNWVAKRYKTAGIKYKQVKGEEIEERGYDEILIYNVLQHTENPQKIIENAKKAGKLIRIFEWIDLPVCEGHPQTLTELKLNKWLGGEGKVEILNDRGCRGKAYYGIFQTNL
jgi:2-polyprenyl-3-methyl-5-hydroxy-6-metoxy-1,4-benzoquinol methylase